MIPILVPPLRERTEDIPLLIQHFTARYVRESGGKARGFTPDALERIGQHPFPGNVRELSNLVERLVFTAPPGPIGIGPVREALPAQVRPRARTGRLSEAVQEFERNEIEKALLEARGNMTQAATRLGLERSHLYKKMKKLGMRPESWSA